MKIIVCTLCYSFSYYSQDLQAGKRWKESTEVMSVIQSNNVNCKEVTVNIQIVKKRINTLFLKPVTKGGGHVFDRLYQAICRGRGSGILNTGSTGHYRYHEFYRIIIEFIFVTESNGELVGELRSDLASQEESISTPESNSEKSSQAPLHN